MANVTINEIRKLVDSYVVVESRYQDCTKVPVRGLVSFQREITRCENHDGVASARLRSMAQVLKHCMDEGKTRKSSTGELLSLAVDYHFGGSDPAKALKRARRVIDARAAV